MLTNLSSATAGAIALVAAVIAAGPAGAESGATGDAYAATAKSKAFFRVVGTGGEDKLKAGLFEWKIVMENDTGEGFLHGVEGNCLGLVLYDGDMDHQSGYCKYVDGDGDVFYERFEHYAELGEGRGEGIGGTGKYADIKSTHQYSFEALTTEDEEQEIDSVARRVGTYRYAK